MKTFILGFSVILCMQIIHANRSSNCKKDLSKLLNAASKFFAEFEREHDISREIVTKIENICNEVSEALKPFTAQNYGACLSSKQIQKDVTAFLKLFFEQRINALNFLHRLENKIDELLEMADCFTYIQNLNCEAGCTGNGCEADLNKLRCKLDEFFEAIPKIGEKAQIDLKGVVDGCDRLGQLSRKFIDQHHLNCASCEIDDSHLLSYVRKFFDEFEAVYIKIQKQFKDLANICDHLADTIHNWKNELKYV